MSVIEFPTTEDKAPHNTGHAVCWHCGRNWQAVWPANISVNYLMCEDCNSHTWIPPLTDDEAITRAAERFESAAHEMRVLRDRLSGDTAAQADKWADAHWHFAKMLRGYLCRSEGHDHQGRTGNRGESGDAARRPDRADHGLARYQG